MPGLDEASAIASVWQELWVWHIDDGDVQVSIGLNVVITSPLKNLVICIMKRIGADLKVDHSPEDFLRELLALRLKTRLIF